MITREITCHYETTDGEQSIVVSLWRTGLGHRDWQIDTDLSDVPDDERASVEQQAIDGYVLAESALYASEGPEGVFPGPPEDA
jgi:hypothetical protein